MLLQLAVLVIFFMNMRIKVDRKRITMLKVFQKRIKSRFSFGIPDVGYTLGKQSSFDKFHSMHQEGIETKGVTKREIIAIILKGAKIL